MHDSVPCVNGFWHGTFGIEISKSVRSMIFLGSSEIWKYIERYVLVALGIRIQFTIVDVLFGIKQSDFRMVRTKKKKKSLS